MPYRLRCPTALTTPCYFDRLAGTNASGLAGRDMSCRPDITANTQSDDLFAGAEELTDVAVVDMDLAGSWSSHDEFIDSPVGEFAGDGQCLKVCLGNSDFRCKLIWFSIDPTANEDNVVIRCR